MEIQTSRKVVLYSLFALSGFCALVYEVLWTKYLALSFGTTILAVSVVTATFMGGLALGSYLLGRYADREKNLLAVYALLEAGIAAFAFLFAPTLTIATEIHIFLERLAPAHPTIAHFIHFVFAVILLIPPAICMGGTFPLMCRFFARKKSGGQIGRLYALNTLGATLGALVGGYLLIPTLGLAATGYLAVAGNLLIAGTTFLLARKIGPATIYDVSAAKRPDQPMQASQHRMVLIGIGLIGFFSMAYEILWTRVLLLFLGNTTYAFSLMLSAFLIGITLGGAIYARKVHPGLNEKKIFITLTVLMGLSVLLTAPFYDRLSHLFLLAHDASGERWWLLSLLSFLIVFAVMCIPTILSGSLLPAAVAILDPGKSRTGEGVGLVVLHNTIGAMLGSLVAGFLLIPSIGLQTSFRVLAALNILLGLALFLRFRTKAQLDPAFGFLPALGLALALVPLSWDQKLMNSGVYCYAPTFAKHGGITRVLEPEKLLQVIEGVETTVAIKEIEEGTTGKTTRYFSVNGKTDGGTGGDMQTQTLVGQIPLLLHPGAKDALVIGLGSGITLGGAKEHPLERIDCVEISPEVVVASQYFVKENRNAIADPRVNLAIEDGRNLLLVKEQKYDVIISQPSNPWQTGNANLFTLDFYRLAASRLNDAGVFGQWIGLYDITPENLKITSNTFTQAFPHTLTFKVGADLIMVGAFHPLVFDYQAMQAQMSLPTVAEVLEPLQIRTPGDLIARHYYLNDESVRAFAADAGLNTDNLPVLEYSFKDNLGGKMFGRLKTENLAALQLHVVDQMVPLVNLGASAAEVAVSLRELHRSYFEAGRNSEAAYFEERAREYEMKAAANATFQAAVENG